MAGRLLAEVAGAAFGVELEKERGRGRRGPGGAGGFPRTRAGPDGGDPARRKEVVSQVGPSRPRPQRVSRRAARHGGKAARGVGAGQSTSTGPLKCSISPG